MSDITFTWPGDPAKLNLPEGDGKKLDIFFQPALSWSGETKGIALLFLENDLSKSEGKDFQKLVKGMLTWIWQASGKKVGDTLPLKSKDEDTGKDTQPALSYFEALYDQFLESPFVLEDFTHFLQKNYTFRIQECVSEMKGTIFPMFPQLDLKVGTETIEPVDMSRPTSKVSKDIFSGQYLPPEKETSTQVADPEDKSAREFIFEDYGRLLMRNALQVVKDYLKNKADPTQTGLDISNIVSNITDADIKKLAGMTSRFMLHGVQLDIDNALQPFYQATGQQFSLSAAKGSDSYKITVKINEEEKTALKAAAAEEEAYFLAFFPFDSESPADHFTYTLPDSESITEAKSPLLNLANAFGALTNPASLGINERTENKHIPFEMPFYKEEPRLFALRKWVKWEGASQDNTTYLFQLPQSLQVFLQQRSPNPQISLFNLDATTRPSNLTDPDFLVENSAYNWSTRINISISRIPKTEGDGYIPDTYILAGVSEAEINVIESLLKNTALLSDTKMHLLYASQGGTTTPAMKVFPQKANSTFFIARKNLATNNPDADPGSPEVLAKMENSETQNFLQVLWEGATVANGGYYFYLPTGGAETAGLFSGGDTTQVFLFIEFDSIATDPIHDFHNNVIMKLEGSPDLATRLLLAKIEDGKDENGNIISEQVPILTIPPGFYGFQFEMPKPPVTASQMYNSLPDLKLKANTKLRETPTYAGNFIRDLSRNTHVKVITKGSTDNWLFVQAGNAKGWIPQINIITNPPINQVLKLKNKTEVYGSSDAKDTKVKVTLQADQEVGIIGKKDSRTEIAFGSNSGWVPNTTSFIETVFVIPPGPDGQYDILYAKRELKNIYQLMGYQIGQDTVSNKTPIGPTVKQKGSNQWQYERLIPGYELFEPASTDPGTGGIVPAPEKNPYNGIGEQLDIQLWWQDIYGNKLSDDTLDKNLFTGYTDPIIGINRWPSVSATYQFQLGASGEQELVVEVAFSDVGYQNIEKKSEGEGAVAKRVKADLETYTRIYYQLSQADVRLKVRTSLDGTWEPTFTPTDPGDLHDLSDQSSAMSLLDFVSGVYRYLEKLYGKLQTIKEGQIISIKQNPSHPFKKTFNISGLTLGERFVQGLTASATICRELGKVHPSLKETDLIKPKYKEVLENVCSLRPKQGPLSHKVQPDESLAGIKKAVEDKFKDIQDVTVQNLVRWNQDTAGLIKKDVTYDLTTLVEEEGIDLKGSSVTSKATDTLNSLAKRIKEALLEALKAQGLLEPVVNFSLSDFSDKYADKENIFNTGATLSIDSLNIRRFAKDFSETFPGYHLAVSEERGANQKDGSAAFLFAVNLGASGIGYDIREQDPNFYAIKPLSTTLFTGSVSVKSYPFVPDVPSEEVEVNALDMNILARDFLVGLEDFLKPETLIPALACEEVIVKRILASKFHLAEAISKTAMPILAEDNTEDGQTGRLEEAQRAIRQRLRDDLVEGYDIEAIVQFQTSIQNKINKIDGSLGAPAPRLNGRAKVLGISLGEDPKKLNAINPKNLDYVISTGYFELPDNDGTSSFTYLFDTKSPEKFGNIYLELEFEPLEIEYNLESIHSSFLASDKLRFILPENLNVYQITDAILADLRKLNIVPAADKSAFDKILDTLAASSLKDVSHFSLEAFEKEMIAVLGSDYKRFREKLLTLANPNYMGKSAVPIPLRYYPQPPSLIFQRAESDDSSLENINDLREWEYKIVYEHQDVAQDSIDCIVRLNVIADEFEKESIPLFNSAQDAASAAKDAADAAEKAQNKAEDALQKVAAAKAEEARQRALAATATDPPSEVKAKFIFPDFFSVMAATATDPPLEEQYLEEAKKQASIATTWAQDAKKAAKAATAAATSAVAAAKAAEKLSEVDSQEANEAAASAGAAKEAALQAREAATNAAKQVDNLFDLLVNFSRIYPDMNAHLALLEKKKEERSSNENENITQALTALEWLSGQIAYNWDSVDIYGKSTYYQPEPGDLHYDISEEPLTAENTNENDPEEADRQAVITRKDSSPTRPGVKPLVPLLDLPGFSRLEAKEDPIQDLEVRTYTYYEGNYEGNLEEGDEEIYAFDPHDYGDSSIPDRVFRIENLDILQYQNAAASIWLSRNKNLVYKKQTNDAFIFQTPAVSFANPAIPFITNDEPFDIAEIDAPMTQGTDTAPPKPIPQDRSLEDHMIKLLDLLEPQATEPIRDDYRYEARLSCRFAFSLATGKGLNDDLVSTLPLLIGLRLSPADSLNADGFSQTLLDYPEKLRKEISTWFAAHKPIEENAYLLFSLDIFSKLDANENSSLPMLRVKQLKLKLKHIKDMVEVRKGNV